jgi:hypothetical protein
VLCPCPRSGSMSRELLNAHKDNLGTTIKFVIFNELSNARNPNNMQVLHTALQHSSELAPKVGPVTMWMGTGAAHRGHRLGAGEHLNLVRDWPPSTPGSKLLREQHGDLRVTSVPHCHSRCPPGQGFPRSSRRLHSIPALAWGSPRPERSGEALLWQGRSVFWAACVSASCRSADQPVTCVDIILRGAWLGLGSVFLGGWVEAEVACCALAEHWPPVCQLPGESARGRHLCSGCVGACGPSAGTGVEQPPAGRSEALTRDVAGLLVSDGH